MYDLSPRPQNTSQINLCSTVPSPNILILWNEILTCKIPSSRQGNVYKKDNLVMEGELDTSRKEFETKAQYIDIF